MAQSFKTLKVSHPTLGEIKVKVDSEDYEDLKEKNLYAKIDNTKENYPPHIAIIGNNELIYAHRYILEKYNLLTQGKNYGPHNGDWADLRKKNFI